MKPKDYIGVRFGRLVVIRRIPNTTYGQTRWKCKCDCGNTPSVNGNALSRGATQSCGCFADENRHKSYPQKKGHLSPLWKGGRHICRDTGYVLLTNAEYPGALFPNKTFEHVVVMSRHIGRRLIPKVETVHHKNGIRDDNKLGNLELWRKRQPSGQRVKDLIIWAKDLLAQYGNDESVYS